LVQQLSREELEDIVSGLQTALLADTDEKGQAVWKLE
jgi:hypothetical protein